MNKSHNSNPGHHPPVQGFIRRFMALESASGMVLIGAAIVALIWANSPFYQTYNAFWFTELPVGLNDMMLRLNLQEWVNDALMVVFFFYVGLEIKKELLLGELSSARKAALPIIAAVGGMVIPASIYTLFNAGMPGAAGWGIAMATDIAFALAVLSLVGPRVPVGLKVFLMAFAIVDDLGAVMVIALFYTGDIATTYLYLSLGAVALAAIGNLAGIKNIWFYLALGFVAWLAMLGSGVHATIAGVLMALTVPARDASQGEPLLQRMVHSLHQPVGFIIMPIFALANAGVTFLGGMTGADGAERVLLGIIAGLITGKFLGITAFSWIAVRLGLASLPEGTDWGSISGVALLGGIGFTMSLFVAGLAFGTGPMLDWAKVGVFGASCVAGVVGWAVLRRMFKGDPEAPGWS